MTRNLVALLILAIGLAWAQPSQPPIAPSGASTPATCNLGALFMKTGASNGLYACTAPNTWTGPYSTSGGGGGAPTDATYITQIPNSSLSAEQALSLLATGILKVTTSTGVITIAAAGTDFAAANATTTVNGQSCALGGSCTTGNAAADGATKGLAGFTAVDFDAASGIISIDYTNGQKATGSVPGFLTAADWTTFNGKAASNASTTVNGQTCALGGSCTTQNAAADGATKGIAGFTAADFDASAGIISLDYTNGQAADASHKGFLTSADWTTFNNKAPTANPTFTGTVTIPTQSQADNSTKAASTAYVDTGLATKPTLNGGGLVPLSQGGTNCAAPYAVNPQTSTYQVVAADFTCFKTIPVASGTFVITLVASGAQPVAGTWIRVINYGSGVVTIARSGQNINGGTASIILQSGSATVPSIALIESDGTNYFAGAGFTNPMTTAGDMIYAGTTGLPTRVAIGAATTVLKGGASAPAFSALVQADLPATTRARGISFSIGDPAGSTLTVAATTTDYITVPFACTISAYNLLIDGGTITVKFWKIATGTAIPTSSNSINTSGVGIASGTAIHSATVTDFTSTTVTANDIIAMNVTAVATAKYVQGVLQCDQ